MEYTNEEHRKKIQILLDKLPHKLSIEWVLSYFHNIEPFIGEEGLECLGAIKLLLQEKISPMQAAKHIGNIHKTIRKYGMATPNALCALWSIGVAAIGVSDEEVKNSNKDKDIMWRPPGHAGDSICFISEALSVDIKIYHDQLIKFINDLTDSEKIVYNLKSEF